MWRTFSCHNLANVFVVLVLAKCSAKKLICSDFENQNNPFALQSCRKRYYDQPKTIQLIRTKFASGRFVSWPAWLPDLNPCELGADLVIHPAYIVPIWFFKTLVAYYLILVHSTHPSPFANIPLIYGVIGV
jgi:hypothetical protein